jgi:hypothetical protein
MRRIITAVAGLLTVATAAPASCGAESTVAPDPKALTYKLPKDIPWEPESAAGSQQAVIYGDPDKPGLYVVLYKWLPHHMSKPHFHANDRVIHVISGTWWVGTGDDWDPDKSTPIPAGSVVTHFGKQVHWDGARSEEAVLEIVGIGPATSNPSPSAKIANKTP